MSKIKNAGLSQYGAEPFEYQQFGTSGTEGVKRQECWLKPDQQMQHIVPAITYLLSS